MDKALAEGSKKLCADGLFELVCRNYNKTNAEYLRKQIEIAKAYLSPEQIAELEQRGIIQE